MRESRVDMHVCVTIVSLRHTGASSFHVGVMYVRECSREGRVDVDLLDFVSSSRTTGSSLCV